MIPSNEKAVGLKSEELEQKLEKEIDRIGAHKNGCSLHWIGEWESASLKTNEHFNPSLATIVRKFDPAYLIGVGFGNLLTHVYCFNGDEIEGVFAVDVSSAVVDIGRATRYLLKECKTPQEFVKLVRDRGGLKRRLTSLDLRELSYVIDTLPKRILFSGNNLAYPQLLVRTEEDFEGIVKGIVSPFYTRLFMGGYKEQVADIGVVLLQQYKLFRKLAIEGRLGILESDIRNVEVLREITELEGYHFDNSVIYLSNLPNSFTKEELALIARLTKPIGHLNIHTRYLPHKTYVPIFMNDFLEECKIHTYEGVTIKS